MPNISFNFAMKPTFFGGRFGLRFFTDFFFFDFFAMSSLDLYLRIEMNWTEHKRD
jgi:hypothetical protein